MILKNKTAAKVGPLQAMRESLSVRFFRQVSKNTLTILTFEFRHIWIAFQFKELHLSTILAHHLRYIYSGEYNSC